jgi:hypothetical protein
VLVGDALCSVPDLPAFANLAALFVEVGLSALILGPLFTGLPLASYFNDPQFFRASGFELATQFRDLAIPTQGAVASLRSNMRRALANPPRRKRTWKRL